MSLGGAGSIYPSKPGKLYAWGSAKGNHLPGLKGDNQGHQCFPEQIFKKTKILQVCADIGTFAVLTEDNKVLCWGSERHNFPPDPKETFSTDLKFKQVTVGDNIVLALSVDGQVYEFPYIVDENSKFPEFLQGKCEFVEACGGVAMVGVHEDDKNDSNISVYCKGKNPLCTGTGKIEKQWTKVEALQNIKLLSIGSTCGIAVNCNEEVFTWGQNRNGNLAHGNRNDFKIPRKVNNCPWDAIDNEKIAVISATRGQPNPKNDFKNLTGQEGPRIHLITER